VKNVSLSKATFVKFRAQSVDFLEISNPRAVLEVTLRKFTCLTVGDTICFTHSGKKFFLDVMEVQPNGAASIIETDCNVDFDEPLGYKESEYGRKEAAAKAAAESGKGGGASGATTVRTLQRAKVVSDEDENANKFKAFTGNAQRIDGRLTSSAKESKAADDGYASAKSSGKSSSVGVGSASASASASAAPAPAPAPAVAPTYQSRIGDKFSKKKAAIAAIVDTSNKFAGSGHKLGGK
jgi:ubiquitin fusion degradation protein 1